MPLVLFRIRTAWRGWRDSNPQYASARHYSCVQPSFKRASHAEPCSDPVAASSNCRSLPMPSVLPFTGSVYRPLAFSRSAAPCLLVLCSPASYSGWPIKYRGATGFRLWFLAGTQRPETVRPRCIFAVRAVSASAAFFRLPCSLDIHTVLAVGTRALRRLLSESSLFISQHSPPCCQGVGGCKRFLCGLWCNRRLRDPPAVQRSGVSVAGRFSGAQSGSQHFRQPLPKHSLQLASSISSSACRLAYLRQ